jgi:hypothetical protein
MKERSRQRIGETNMRRLHFTWLAIGGMLLCLNPAAKLWSAQQPPSEAVPVSVVVSVEARHGKEIPAIDHKEDVRVFERHERLRATDWIPLQGSQADLELLVLIDEATSIAVANQFDDLRRFMEAQPSTTRIAVGYMEVGTVRMAQNFTSDHQAAGKALRIPPGAFAGGNSPYLSITDAIKRWPESKARHAIFLISDGTDPLQPGIEDSYLDQAVETAQRTGTQISAIFASRAGHFGHSFWRINQGQTNLSELTDKTGGESYFQGMNTPVAFSPFLDEFAERLNHQYKLTFLIKPGQKPTYKHVRLETEIPNAELVTADQVYIPAAK